MKKNLFILIPVILFAALLNFPDSLYIVLICALFALPFGAFIVSLSEGNSEEKEVLWKLFILALSVRALYGAVAYHFGFWNYFATDATTYDVVGNALAEYLKGNLSITKESDPSLYYRLFSFSGPGWGMYYIVASVYLFTGKNPVAGNFFCSVLGAAASPVVYMLAKEIYRNKKVALISSALVGFMPGFINWSSFMLKDGIIIFLLALSILMVIRLQKQFSLLYMLLLLVSIIGIISLRFYIFPMLSVAILASFLIGVRDEDTIFSVFRRVFALLILGVVLTYAGVLQGVTRDVQRYGTLERLNNARLDQARSAASGLEEADVSTVEGAVTVLPIGFAYLMFAPLPWQVTSIRAALTQPEMIVWWLMIPFLIRGFIYSIKNKFRETLPILIFTLMLTVGYSIFQGNIGTAYRQRTQIQVFHFIFVAVGWVVTRERKENERALSALRMLRATRKMQERQV